MQQRRREPLVDLAAKTADVNVDDVGLRIEMVVPHRLEQHGSRHHLPGVAHQVFEDAELARLQIDPAAGANDGPGEEVQLQIGELQTGDRLRRRDRSPVERLQPGEQLGKGERLDEIVVAARLQAADAVVDLAEGAQESRPASPLLPRARPGRGSDHPFPAASGRRRAHGRNPHSAIPSPSVPVAARSARWPLSARPLAR